MIFYKAPEFTKRMFWKKIQTHKCALLLQEYNLLAMFARAGCERRIDYRNNPIWIVLSEFVEQEKSEDVFFSGYLCLVWSWLESVVQSRALLSLSVLGPQTVLVSFSWGLCLDSSILTSNSRKVALQNTETGEIPETRRKVCLQSALKKPFYSQLKVFLMYQLPLKASHWFKPTEK